MTSHRKNLLADPEFLAEATAGDILRDALNEPAFVREAVVANRRNNDIADPGTFISDMETLDYYSLINKYGREVADNRSVFQREAEEQFAILNRDRSTGEKIIDSSLSAGAAGFSFVGGIASTALGAAGAINELGTGGRETRLTEASTYVAGKSEAFAEWITNFQSDNLEDRKELNAIAVNLNEQDSTDQMNREIATGMSVTIAEWRRFGRDILNRGELFYEDGAVAADIIAGALGSIVPSAKTAQFGVEIAKATVKKITTRKTANKLAGVVGSALGIGVGEASGTYTDTVNFIMSLDEATMYGSPEYARLRSEGKEHDEAQRIVSANTATEAAARQLPAAAALGLFAARFNTNPLKAFKGKSFLHGLREVGIQTLEEGGQSLTSELNKNLAVRNQVIADQDVGAGLGSATAEGAFAGFGMAGVIGAPNAIKSTAGSVIRGAVTGAKTVATGITTGIVIDATGEGRDIAGKARRADRIDRVTDALDATSKAASKVAKVAKPVTDPVVKVAKKVAAVVGEKVVTPATKRVEDFNQRPNKELQLQTLEASGKAVEAAPDNVVIAAVDKIVIALSSTQASLMTDEDVIEAANTIIDLTKEVKTLDPTTREHVLLTLSSPEFRKIRERFVALRKAAAEAAPDLNQTQTAETEVTAETIKETLKVAFLDPTKVNPDHVNKILKQEDTDLTSEQIVLLEVARDIAIAVNNHRGEQVQVSSRKSIALSKKPAFNNKEAPEVLDIESASRSIQVSDFVDARGNALRSINSFAADILEALQSETGIIADTNEEEGTISTDGLISVFGMFVEHLRNKVGALNKSLAKQSKKGTGSTEMFRSLVAGERMIDAGVAGGARGVYVHTNSPKSVATAEAVANDAKVAAEVYNILVRKFPNQFPGGEVTIPSLDPLPTTTAAEAVEETTTTEAPAEVVVSEETDEQTKTIKELNAEMDILKKEMKDLRNKKDDQSDIDSSDAAMDPFFDAIDAQDKLIAALDAKIDAEFKARRERQAAADTTAGDEVISPQAQIAEEADTQTTEEEDDDGVAQKSETEEVSDPISQDVTEIQEDLDAMNGRGVGKFTLATDSQVKAIRRILDYTAGILGVDLNKRIRSIFVMEGEGFAGYAFWARGVMALSSKVLEGGKGDPKQAAHVISHEIAHVWDSIMGKDGKLKSVIDGLFSSGKKGTLYLEILEAIANHKEFRAYFSYALDFTNDDVKSQELFAELVAMYLMNPDFAKKFFPKGVNYVENLIADHAELSELETGEDSGSETQDESTAQKLGTPPTEKFDETFEARNTEDLEYTNGEEILDLLTIGENTSEEYMAFAKKLFKTLVSGMNDRLNDIKVSKSDGRSLKQAIIDGDSQSHIRDFKNTMLVDPETGEYNPELLSIAVVAMIDWMSSVRSADPSSNQLRKTLQKLGVELLDLNDTDMHNILNGVSPRFVAETMSKRIMKMWDVKVNNKGQMVDARGAAEGLVKELLEVIEDKFDYIQIHEIPTRFTRRNGDQITTPTINVKGLREVQKKIGLSGRDSVQRVLAPEEDNGPSFGEKIKQVAKKNRRGTVDLSSKERKALKNEQDVPHLLANGISSLIGVMGFSVYKKMRGHKSVDHLSENHPLRNSINGKNLSIERDWDDAHMVTAELQGDNQDTPVYFRIDITKVGRHQHSGINSQNNTTLRVMVSSSTIDLDMTNQDHIDGFWLTVAQASKLFKVENVLHEKILAEIQGEFAKEFGEATKIIEEYLKTGKMDGDALFEATGEISMEQLNSIYAVADLNYQSRSTNALTKFHVTLGFELDGKTDGPSHMMNNFGQGLLSPEDYTNFKRVGMFLGTITQTLNSFFSNEDNKDLYNETSVQGMNKMYSQMANADPAQKAALFASARFAERFGDFTIGPDGLPEMTRDTSKNPMTKTVYGAGLESVSRGIAEEMILEFYKQATNMPKGADPATYFGYPDFESDFELLFRTPYPKGVDWTQSVIDKRSRGLFVDIITKGIGEMISSAAKEVIGKPITKVADLLVYITNVQTEFMILLYDKKLLELAERRASQEEGTEGWIARHPKTNKGIQQQLSVQDFADLKKEIESYGPTYENGVQTLAVGAFSPQPSKLELSSTMKGSLRVKSNMSQPELARVKVIPYMTQGRGDAMVVNTIFGSNGAPTDMFAVHDGFYVPITKIKAYSKMVNDAVMKVWDRDVIGDAVEDFERFTTKVTKDDAQLLKIALEKVKKYPYESTVRDEINNASDLMSLLRSYHRGNAARKAVFKVIPLGVDHLGGAEEAATRNEDKEEVGRHEINELIADKLNQKRPSKDTSDREEQENIGEKNQRLLDRARAAAGMRAKTDKAAEKDNTEINLPSSILITDTNAILERLGKSSNRLTIRKAVKLLQVIMNDTNLKVVIGGLGIDLIQYYDDINGEGAAEKAGITIQNMPKGWTDVNTGIMYILSNSHETLVHEMIHLATYNKVLAHYDGTKTNAAVTRLETLMEEFMAIDFSDRGKTLQRAVNSAKAAIIVHQTNDTPVNKTAALNEFMAWTLSNAALTKDLKTRDTVLARMAKAVKIIMRRILGDNMPTDMYQHILFNTLMLHDAWASIQTSVQSDLDKAKTNTESKVSDVVNDEDVIPPSIGDGGDTNGVDKDNNGDGNDGGRGNEDGGVTPSAAKKTNFWIDLMRKKLSDIKDLDAGDPTRGPKVTQFRRFRNAALNAVTRLDFGGFVLSEYEKHTFRSIHMVLATEMRLNTQSSIALNQMFEHVTSNLKPEMFGKGKQGQELYSTVVDLLGDTKNDEGVSDAMAVLLALSQTSKKFREALDQLPIPGKKQINDGTLNGFLTGITGIMMNKALGTIDIADSGAKELLDVLASNLIREDTEREYTLLRALMGSLDKADKFMGGAMNELAERTASFNTRMNKEDRNLLTKLVTSTFAASTAFLSSDRSSAFAEGAKRITHMGVNLDHAVFIREFVTEVIGADNTNAEVIMMLDRTNYAVQAIRQNYKEQLPVIMQNAFQVHPDESQWKAFHRILGGLDFAHLFDISNPERSFNLLKDASLLSSKTVDAEAVIVNNFDKSTSDNILEKAKQLAGFMNRKGAGHQLLHNAYAINKLSGKYDETMTEAIDTLISLYALEIADQAQKDQVIEMYENEPEAVQNLVTYIKALNKEEDMKEFSENARMQGRKGWIPDHGKKNSLIVIQRDDKGDEMIKMGYVRVGDVKADASFSTVKRGYYTTTVRQGTAYSQGVLQSVQGTYRGVNSVTGISVAPDVSGVITGSVLNTITAHLNSNRVSDDKEVLSPVHNEKGEVWAYERIINPDLMEQYTQPKANLALMLGAWAGRQVEEKLASKYNFELLTELKRIYDDRKSGDDKLFIDVSDPKLKDPIYRDSWRVISPDTRKQIAIIFGEKGGFMVRKDMMNLSLGHADPTIVDVWTGKTRMNKGVQAVIQAGAKAVMGDKAVTILSRGEEGIQGIVAGAKDVIVVRSLIVPYMNTQANVFQLMARGVPLKTMTNGYIDKMAELEQFNVNTIRLMEIDTNIALAGNNKNQVVILQQQKQVILDENLRMSIAPLIEAGQYKNISEGITELDVELTSGRMKEWIENQVNKLPGPLQTITKYGLLSKDTVIYKMANKAVQYGDFLAKAIYYDHLTKVRGLSDEAALRQINEEYVNFSILPGRTRSALEAVGATWFLTFKIRTMKVALNMMRENPARALILILSGIGEFGSAFNDNLGTVVFQDRFGYSVGWTMLLGSPELNPWAQLWGWS